MWLIALIILLLAAPARAQNNIPHPGIGTCPSGQAVISLLPNAPPRCATVGGGGSGFPLTEPVSAAGNAITLLGPGTSAADFLSVSGGTGALQHFNVDSEGDFKSPSYVGGSGNAVSNVSGSPLNTTGSASGTALTLASALDFANGQGIYLAHAGVAMALSTPGTVTATPTYVSGSTLTYTYSVAAIDTPGLSGIVGGGLTAASVGSGITNAATLNATNYNTVSWPSDPLAIGYALYRNNGSVNELLWRVSNIKQWRPSEPKSVGALIVPNTANGHMYIVTTTGVTNGAAEPSWCTTAACTVTDGSTGLVWTEDGTPTVSFVDNGAFAGSYYNHTANTNPYDPNIPDTPPGSALADALVTTVASGGGTTSITLANAATTSTTSQPVAHDDTAAINSYITSAYVPDLGSTYRTFGRRQLLLPLGTYNISSPILIPYDSGGGAARPFEFLGQGGFSTDAPFVLNSAFGSPKAYSLFNENVSGGNQGVTGSVIRTLLPVDGVHDDNATTAPGTFGPAVIDVHNIVINGYGVGQTTGLRIGTVSPTTGMQNTEIGQWNRLSPLILNFDKGIDGAMQWSYFDEPMLIANRIGIKFEPGHGSNDSNTIMNPQVQCAQWPGAAGIIYSDGASDDTYGGNIEFCDQGMVLENIWQAREENLTMESSETTAQHALWLTQDNALKTLTGLASYGDVLKYVQGYVASSGASIEIGTGVEYTMIYNSSSPLYLNEPPVVIDSGSIDTDMFGTEQTQYVNNSNAFVFETMNSGGVGQKEIFGGLLVTSKNGGGTGQGIIALGGSAGDGFLRMPNVGQWLHVMDNSTAGTPNGLGFDIADGTHIESTIYRNGSGTPPQPIVSSGTATMSGTATDMAFEITAASLQSASVVVTWGTAYTLKPNVTCSEETTAAPFIITPAAATLTITGSALSGTSDSIMCNTIGKDHD